MAEQSGPALRRLREAANVGRSPVANRAEVHISTIRKFERGGRIMNADKRERVILAYTHLHTMPERENCRKGERLDGRPIYRKLKPGERRDPRRKRSHYESAITSWGNELRAAAALNMRTYGPMPECRRCPRTCKVPNCPGARVTYCEAKAWTGAEVMAFAQLKSEGAKA